MRKKFLPALCQENSSQTRVHLKDFEQFSIESLKIFGLALPRYSIGLKNSLLFFPIRSKTNTNRDSLSRVSSQLHVFTSFDWFMVLSVVLGIG